MNTLTASRSLYVDCTSRLIVDMLVGLQNWSYRVLEGYGQRRQRHCRYSRIQERGQGNMPRNHTRRGIHPFCISGFESLFERGRVCIDIVCNRSDLLVCQGERVDQAGDTRCKERDPVYGVHPSIPTYLCSYIAA